MLSVENRESKDERSLGELFLYFSDELSDITWIQVFQVMLQMYSKLLSNDCELSEDKISELTDAFMSTIPSVLKERLKVAWNELNIDNLITARYWIFKVHS